MVFGLVIGQDIFNSYAFTVRKDSDNSYLKTFCIIFTGRNRDEQQHIYIIFLVLFLPAPRPYSSLSYSLKFTVVPISTIRSILFNTH